MPDLIDLTGKTFGKLIVLSRASNKGKYTMWNVKCTCPAGTEFTASSRKLIRGKYPSCGCETRRLLSEALTNDLTGKTFGRLTVLEKDDTGGRLRAYWKVKCSCPLGTIKVVSGKHLVDGKVIGCGCMQKERRAIQVIPFMALYNAFCSSAKRTGREVSLSFEDFLEFTKQKECHYCGRILHWAVKQKIGEPFGHNLDRKNNDLGYSKENCVACCGVCNKSRGDRFTYEEWLEHGAIIRERRKRKESDETASRAFAGVF